MANIDPSDDLAAAGIGLWNAVDPLDVAELAAAVCHTNERWRREGYAGDPDLDTVALEHLLACRRPSPL